MLFQDGLWLHGLQARGKLKMSSTNRGSDRAEADFYQTPDWCVQRLVEKLGLPGGKWLEPGAGEGDLIKAMGRGCVYWTALELREECRANLEKIQPPVEIIITDKFIDPSVPEDQKPLHGRHFDVAFGNPPYSLAIEFIQESLKYCDIVVMLLRLNFLSTRSRAPFMQEHTPDVYVLPDRPSFTGHGTDSSEYAWFVWDKSKLPGDPGLVVVLNTTSPAEKQAARENRIKTAKEVADNVK